MIFDFNAFINHIPTKKTYVLFGEKLTYSISSNIHNKIFEEYSIDAEYIYVELKPHELLDAIAHLKKYYNGANVTIPFKADVIPLLENIDPTAKRLSSVNTIHIENGVATGYNTDIIGVYESLMLDKISLKNKKIALLGYGGTANVVADIIANEKFTVFGRNIEKANTFLDGVRKNHPNVHARVRHFDDFTDNYDIIFNTTPIGMNTYEGQSPIKEVRRAKYVFDVIYNPQLTKLLSCAYENRISVRNGLFMLYTQALFAQNIFNDIDVTRPNDIYDTLENELFLKRLGDKNIVIFGFMGCGKSTISKVLSKSTGLPVIDTDNYIEKQQNMKIKDIFEKFGEPHFRNLETECSKELSSLKNTIISVGGGFVLNEENVKNLSENSVFVYLDTKFDTILERIAFDKSRPLAKNNIKELFEKRDPFYKSIEAITIKSPKPIKLIAQEIIKKI